MPKVLKQLKGRYQELSVYGLCGLVWGAAVLGDLQPQAFDAANRLLECRTLEEFTARVGHLAPMLPRLDCIQIL